LISLYTFDSSNANDSKSTNNGTLVGDATFTPGIGGGTNLALLLSGAGYVSNGVVPAFNFTNTGTIEAWIRADFSASYGGAPCMFGARQDASGEEDYSIYLLNGKTTIADWNGSALSQVTVPNAGTTWHHLAVTFNNGSNEVVYWDGSLAGTATEKLTAGTNEPGDDLGSSNPTGTEFWIGALDDVAYYSTALSGGDILNHYQAMGGIAAPPSITISQVVSNQVQISWKDPAFILESARTLIPPAAWTPVPGVIGTSFSTNVSTGNAFYRLIVP
jgi:hypothetical protein